MLFLTAASDLRHSCSFAIKGYLQRSSVPTLANLQQASNKTAEVFLKCISSDTNLPITKRKRSFPPYSVRYTRWVIFHIQKNLDDNSPSRELQLSLRFRGDRTQTTESLKSRATLHIRHFSHRHNVPSGYYNNKSLFVCRTVMQMPCSEQHIAAFSPRCFLSLPANTCSPLNGGGGLPLVKIS